MSLFAWIFAALLIASAAEAGPRVSLERLEASVNSGMILRSDIVQFRKTLPLRSQLDPLFAGTAVGQAGPSAKDDDIVQFLIDERIVLQQFPVTDAEVEQEINSIQASNKINRDSLRRALSEQGFTFDDYFEMIRSSAAKRNLIDRDIRTKVTISDDDVRNHYLSTGARGSAAPSSYRLGLIAVSPANFKSPTAAREVAERALADLRKGEAFEEVARRLSDHPTRDSGGDLGLIADENLNPAFREQLKRLRPGETSGIFGNPQAGWMILRLVEIGAVEDTRFKRVKEEIRAQLAAKEYQRQIGLWLERQRQIAFVHRAGAPTAAAKP